MQEYTIYGFDEKLKTLRKKHNFTQQYVADTIGVTKSTVNRYENESMPPSLASAIKIAIMFNVSVDYLVGLSDKSFLYLYNFTEKQQAFILETLKQYEDLFPDDKKE